MRTDRKRLLLAWIGSAGLLACLAVAGWALVTIGPGGGTYNGRPLLDWVMDASMSDEKALAVLRMSDAETVQAVGSLLSAQESWRWKLVQWTASKLPRRLTRSLFGNRSHSAAAVRDAAARTLEKLGPAAAPAIPALAENLGDETPAGDRSAVALAAIGTPSIPSLTNALAHSNPRVRMRAAYGLGEIGPAALDAYPALCRLAEDPVPSVADSARRSTRLIGSPEIHGLHRLIYRDRSSNYVAGLRIRLKVDPELHGYVQPLLNMARSADPVQRQQGLAGLGAAGATNAEAFEVLTQSLTDPATEVVVTAAQALGQIGHSDPSAVARLQALEASRVPEIGNACRRALEAIRNAR